MKYARNLFAITLIGLLAGMTNAKLAQASNAMLLEESIDVQTKLDLQNFPTKTLYRARDRANPQKTDPNQFYYLPANIRFALDDEGRPMLTVYKYNLVYNDGNFVDLKENQAKSEVFQGGTLKATFTMGLRANELETLEQAIIEKGLSAQPRISRLPLSSAEFSVTLTDPENPDGAKVLLGPFPAPISADVIAVQEPLSRSATDIFYTILTKKNADGKTVSVPDAPINILMTFAYEGYGLDGKVTVTGVWDNLYKASEIKAEAKANYWFVDANASYADAKSQLITDAGIEIVYAGAVPEGSTDELENAMVDKILAMAFDIEGLAPAPEDSLDPDAGTATSPDGQEIFGKPVGASIGFAAKAVSRGKSGNINFSKAMLSRVSREDARYGVLDMQGLDPERNVLEVTPSDWSVARVIADLSADVTPFFAQKVDGEWKPQNVAIIYGDSPPIPVQVAPGASEDFGAFPAGADPKVEVVWTLDFAQYPDLIEELGVEDNRSLKSSYAKVVDVMSKQVYAGKGAPNYNHKDDLRLMSSVSLTRSLLPITPELCDLSVEVLGPDGGVDWAKAGNSVTLQIVQEIDGVKKPLVVPLGRLALEDSYSITEEPFQAFILNGPGVKSSKLVASRVMVSNEEGKRLTAKDVVVADELLSGGFITIDLEERNDDGTPKYFDLGTE